ncbi:sensor domain-containing protein [Kitasatospora sp. YST-16]|uniref:sensor histidine kinase n=1 Tax=unclassified Kitasatospora TaxID=2633591 RepID=UPI0004C3958D|nr:MULTISPECIES: sensor histidine kinase [unclassified Kitasatospora]WAL72340.1 sensor domain-containing protein [Kitasatospora sp. YST-16]WNW38388.1 sensor domain-containing protein [Streptomyces sp. Li-HN-5-13]
MEDEAKRPSLYGAPLWREVRNALLNLPIGVAGFAVTAVLLTAGLGLAVTVIGLPLLAFGLGCCRQFGRLARARARADLGSTVPEPEPLRPSRAGVAGRVMAALGDGLSWRSALYCVVLLIWGILGFVLTLLLLVVGWPVLPWAMRMLSGVSRWLVEVLLAPGALAERVRELEDDRGVVVDTAAADLRRIERDLHDGAQARLVALAMDLGLAKEKLTEDPAAAQQMVDAAHGEVKLALQELRDLARGIHPAVLTDRGLDAALSSVAARCTLPGGVRVHVELGGERPDSAVEGIAYFTVSELLTNASKHSGARTASVDVWRQEDRLMLTVRDDGRGGARVHPGGGLAGLAERAESVDGVFVVDSPAEGPTSVTVELPWRTRAGHKG